MAFNHWVEGSSPSRITNYFNIYGIYQDAVCAYLVFFSQFKGFSIMARSTFKPYFLPFSSEYAVLRNTFVRSVE